jgi:hypothetical protein
MNNTKNLFVTPNEKLLCIKGTEHLFSVCHKTSDFVTETVAENIEKQTAHLFAAAPDLLSAVDSCLEIMIRAIGERLPIQQGTECEETDWQTVIRNARESLRKAKGEA